MLKPEFDMNHSLKIHQLTENLIQASAASNIALIKYMGKIEGTGNRPTNSSISYTMDHLRTFVSVKPSKETDSWSFWKEHSAAQDYPLDLSESGQKKYLSFLDKLKTEFKINEKLSLQSVNNFPSDAGLASSASSFAALTWAIYLWSQRHVLVKQSQHDFQLSAVERLSKLSRQGSGSSCRSFFSPWGLWRSEGAEPIPLPQKKLHHFVLLIEKGKKEISSSEAHRLVSFSPLFAKDKTGLSRPDRAQKRQIELQESLQKNQWKKAYEICWDEFIDMHELFHTSSPSFRYMNQASERALRMAQELWHESGMGPLVTMDAGPNVHFLFREDDFDLAQKWKNFYRTKKFEVLDSWTQKGYEE